MAAASQARAAAAEAGGPGPVVTRPDAPRAFHVMAKPTGAVCNLDCEYCFFLSKEMLYPGSRFKMAADLQETYIWQLLEAHARAAEAGIAWQGGEPTMMGLDFFRRSIELRRKHVRPGQRERRSRNWTACGARGIRRVLAQKRTRVTGCSSMPFGACPVTSWISSKKPRPRSVIRWWTCFQLVVAWSWAMNVLRAALI